MLRFSSDSESEAHLASSPLNDAKTRHTDKENKLGRKLRGQQLPCIITFISVLTKSVSWSWDQKMLSITVNSQKKGVMVSFPEVHIFLNFPVRSVFNIAYALTMTIPRELVFSEVVEDVVIVGRLEPLSASLSWLPGTGWNSCGEQLFQEARSTRASAGAEPWKALSSVQLVELELHAPLAQQATPARPRPRGRPG